MGGELQFLEGEIEVKGVGGGANVHYCTLLYLC